ncbi:VanW family protein [Janibacter sp. HTCC2649]|uniref:VanW family protein n=1 Tax=Janibacter sp. HTCC2649 TaxID=313589 RepID=UPI0002E5FF1B|nr:VanW family protein [Janibacter sp. HTCC2649]
MTDAFDQQPGQPRRRRGAIAVLVGAFVLLVAGYVGVAAYASGRTPADTKVGGVQVGGLDPAAARKVLETAVAQRGSAPVALTAGGKSATIAPAEAGLAIDLDASVEDLTGFSLNPVKLVSHLTGGATRSLETEVDDSKLKAAVTKAAQALAVAPKEGSISVAGGKVAVVAPVKGQAVEVDKTADLIADSWPRTAPIVAPVTASTPAVSAEELQRVKTEFADKAVSGPIAVKAGDKTFEISAASLAAGITFPADADGKITPKFDDKIIIAAVTAAADKADATAKATDATVSYASGQPAVVPSKTGVALDPTKIVAPVTAALTSPERAAIIPVTVSQPKFTTEQAKATLPKGMISTFTTHFPANGGGRVSNIRLAARTLNNTYVAPGATFSLNGVLGKRTPEKGYVKGGVISEGRLSENYGGGISQVSTTLFNAAFFAGVKFEQYQAHGFYISRYPEGREATISFPYPDNRWTNTTDGGIVIRSSSSGGQITVSFYGTKKWDIVATKSPRRNVVTPKKITDPSPKCITQNPTPGFDVTVTRIFKQGGATLRTEAFNTHYNPEDDVTCTHPDAK